MLSSRFLSVLVAGGLLVVSCVAPAGQPGIPAQPATATPQPAMATPPAATPTPPSARRSPASDSQRKLNLDEIFPAGEGRDLVLMNCLTCHGLVRIVWGQRDAARWGPVKNRHRERVIGLSDEKFNTLFAYLIDNFNATKPVPDLPQWYLELERYVDLKKPQ
jgi:hypothetical protein